MRLPFAFRLVVLQLRDRAAGDGPEVEAGHAAVWAVAAAVFFKQFAVDFSVMVNHPHPTLYRQITKTQHIRALHTEQQDHFRSPDTDAFQ